MKIFVSTGEMSGDLHLSYLVGEVLKADPTVEFYGVVGDHSKKAGVEVVQDIRDLAIMGFTEALKKYSYLKRKAHEYLEFIEKNGIEKVILVDYGGFNLKFLELLKKRLPHVETYYYIPPKLWVWGEGRIKKLKLADHIMVIFPWEVEFYRKHGVEAVYYGNPFIDKYKVIERRGDSILLLPGSRKQEVGKLLPEMLKVVRANKGESFLLKLAKEEHSGWVEEDLSTYENLEVNADISLADAIEKSKTAIAASGTVILELALMGIPGVVVYKTGLINELIARYILKLGYVSLPNLTLNEEVYPELLQKDCNSENIWKKTEKILKDPKGSNAKIMQIREKLSGDNVILSYAKYILEGK